MTIYPPLVLVLLITGSATLATSVDWTFYKMVEPGQTVTGRTGNEVTVFSDRECSLR